MKALILASASVGRRNILSQTKYPFAVEVSNYEEDMGLDMLPDELATVLSRGKAIDVAKNHRNAVVLAADSFGVVDGQLLGKPHTQQRAKEMLSLLSGRCHKFLTGFTIIDVDTKQEYSKTVKTKVYFKQLTPEDIDGYLAKEDVLQKAGAYTIQGLGKHFITKIEGSYNNVCGLPLDEVGAALKDFGIDLNKVDCSRT